MEKIFTNQDPGLYEIAETILLYLDVCDLVKCKRVCKTWNTFLNNPWFWMEKCSQKTFPIEAKHQWNTLIKILSANQHAKTSHLQDKMVQILIRMSYSFDVKLDFDEMRTPFYGTLTFQDISLLCFILNQLDYSSIKEEVCTTPFSSIFTTKDEMLKLLIKSMKEIEKHEDKDQLKSCHEKLESLALLRVEAVKLFHYCVTTSN